MFKSPIEWFKEFLTNEIAHDLANMAFDWLKILVLAPTDFSKYPKVDVVYDFVYALASLLCVVFAGWALMKMIFDQMAGVQSRSITEIMAKTGLAFILSASAPWLLSNVLIKLNNHIVQYFLDQGLDTTMLEAMTVIPSGANTIFILAILTIIVMFIILGMQYVQRIGEFIVLLISSPLAAHSIVTENFDVWSVWWREAVSVVFSQAFQLALLWLILNLLTGTEKLSDYFFAIGLMIILLKGPKFIRQFLYSSGAGKVAVGTVGGYAKTSMYRYAASRIVK